MGITHTSRSNKVLAQSEKVQLRRLAPSDAAAFLAYRNDPEVARFQSWEHMDAERARNFLLHCARVDPLLQPGTWVQIAVSDPSDGVLLGDMGWFLSHGERFAEIGITLSRDHQGRGLAQAAMKLAIAYLFNHCPIERIICGADPRNKPSLRMIRALGFRFTHHEPGADKTAQDEMFELTRADRTAA